VVSSVSRRSWWSSIEWCYATVALFALTQGPVYQLWRASGAVSVRSGVRSIDAAVLATFVLIQLPGLLFLARTMKPPRTFMTSTGVLVLLVGWLSVSVFWATLSRHSIIEVLALIVTISFGLYLAERFETRQLMWVVCSAMQLGVVLSILAVDRAWFASVSESGDSWAGIYFNRNSLGPVAATGVISALAVLGGGFADRRQQLIVTLPILLMVGVDSYVLVQSRSQTSQVFLVVALVIAGTARAAQWLLGEHIPRRTVIPMLVVGAMTLMVSSVYLLGDRLVALFGETSDVNGRTQLWSFSWSGFLLEPWFGWGWLSAWHTPSFLSRDLFWTLTNEFWSHSTFLDLLLGGGVVAFALFVLYAAKGVWDAAQSASSSALSMAVLAIVSLILLSMTQESFFIGSHFYTALVVAGFRIAERRTSVP
jgi:O-antigen ligase